MSNVKEEFKTTKLLFAGWELTAAATQLAVIDAMVAAFVIAVPFTSRKPVHDTAGALAMGIPVIVGLGFGVRALFKGALGYGREKLEHHAFCSSDPERLRLESQNRAPVSSPRLGG